MALKSWLLKKFVGWLNHEFPFDGEPPCDFQRLSDEIRPCDVLLVEGRTRVGNMIKTITTSPWTHSALYLGRLSEIDDPALRCLIQQHYDGDDDDQLLIEPLLGYGTIIRRLDVYEGEHLRICRPSSLTSKDAQIVISRAADHLGVGYDIRQLIDLARFLFPFGIIPRRWRSSLFKAGAGEQTKTVCSTMIAEVFSEVHYPVLPVIHRDEAGDLHLYKRNTRLYTPSDFDYSPYFDIIKYPILGLDDLAVYRQLPWDEEGLVCNAVGDCFVPPTSGVTNRQAVTGQNRQMGRGSEPRVAENADLAGTSNSGPSLSR